MLLYKGWLETRFKLLFSLAVMAVFLLLFYSMGTSSAPSGNGLLMAVLLFSMSCVGLVSGLLAGAGITTQPTVRSTKGLHGSILYTLSLPVSRFRLLAVRAGLGWVEMAAAIGFFCCGMWAVFPLLRATATPAQMFEYEAGLIAFATALYFMSVFLATFLDDRSRMVGTMIAFGALWWLSNHTALPPSADIFRAMGSGSPLLAHTIPWPAIAISLGLATVLFLAALKVVQTREY